MLDLEVPTISIVGKLVKAGIPVLVYRYCIRPSKVSGYVKFKHKTIHEIHSLLGFNHSGDQDSVIPLIGSRRLVHGLAEELGLKTTVPYRVWFAGMQVIHEVQQSFTYKSSCLSTA